MTENVPAAIPQPLNRSPLTQAVDKVNNLFAANGIDLGTGSGADGTKAVWEVLTEDTEVHRRQRTPLSS